MSKSVPLFIADVLKVNAGADRDYCSGQLTYEWFKAWCIANEIKPVSYVTMNKRLRKEGVMIFTTTGNQVKLLNKRAFQIDSSEKHSLIPDVNAKHFSEKEKVNWWREKLELTQNAGGLATPLPTDGSVL